jgi:hypothetical protein
MLMKEPDSLDALLHEWKIAEPNEELDQRVIAAYQSNKHPGRAPSRLWRWFWTTRVSIPAPALVAAAIAVFALVLWLRPLAAPTPPPQAPGVVTRLNVTGFQPLPNGDAKVVPAMEVQR